MRALYRRSRAFRVVCWVLLLAPLWQILEFVSDDDFQKYSHTGDAILLTVWMLFAAWAWWYGEDRDRRRKAKTSERDGADSRDGDAG